MNTKPATAPQQPQQPQQHLQLSRKRHDFLESTSPCCGYCVAAEAKLKPEVEREADASSKSLRVPFLTPGGTLVIPFDSDPRYHWWKGGQSVKQTLAEVRARMASEQKEMNEASI